MSSAFISMGSLEAIKYADGKLQLLDQRLLPLETVYLDVDTPQAAWQQIKVTAHGAAVLPAKGSVASVMCHTCMLVTADAVCWGRNCCCSPRRIPAIQILVELAAGAPLMQDMVVRGAPAIGVTGALALAVHLIAGGRGRQYSSVQACLDDVTHTMDYLVTRCAGGVPACTSAQPPSKPPHRVGALTAPAPLLLAPAAAPLLSTCPTQQSSSRRWQLQLQQRLAPQPSR